DVFGMIAVMSPFFYHNEFDVDGRLHEHPFYQRYHIHPEGLRIWLDMGGAEGLFMERYAREEAQLLVADGFVLGQDLMLLLDPGAGHSQLDWAHRVHSPLLFFFGEIGQPASVRLVGDHTIGQRGPDKWMNPVVTYTSGFVRTGLPGVFHVDHPEVLAVLPDGRMKGLACGSTVVHYTEAGVSASKEMTVVEEVPELVQVTVHVKVPNETPPYPTIYAGIEVTYKEDGSYSGTAMIPHGLTFTFRISRGFGLHERLGEGSDIIHRSFTTNQDMVLCYEVEAWDQELH
ncbi:alpha/beta hydrolase, partial [Peribacillus sp. NPDC056705]|uniref:alpha/beta hydrolase n=1 Tax=Peribacillus sp. NPDC056705 TaxID=3345918 RepID=UPI00374A6D89